MRRPQAPTVLSLLLAGLFTAGSKVGPALAAAGDIDPTFGDGGKTTFNYFPGSESARGAAIQADGKIVVVVNNTANVVVLRLDSHGVPDPSFDGDGMVVTDLGEPYDDANAVAIQPDGKIVVGGAAGCGSFAVVRYNADGTLDTSFDGDGKVFTDFGGCDVVHSVAIQPDGKILAAGVTFSPFVNDFAIARYNPDGSLDASFGLGGKLTTDFGGYDGASAVALQSDGKIVAFGNGGSSEFLIARYDPNGSLDPSFDVDGRQTVSFDGYGFGADMAIQADGKIVIAGYGTYALKFALARLNLDGTLDPTFDGDGKVTTDLGGDNRGATVAIQSDGKIVMGGTLYHDYDASFALARYDSHGTLDPSFGGGDGIVTTDFGKPGEPGVLCPPARPDCSEDVLNDIVIQPDGKILAVGGAGPCVPTCYVAMARYDGVGPDDTVPPTLTLAASPSVLWPPNHRLVSGHVDVAATDNADPSPDVTLIAATSNEPDLGEGSGDFPNDIVILSDTEFQLRSEREGSGEGREYRICYRATDDAENTTEACCVVRVPRDRSGRAELVGPLAQELVIFGSANMSVHGVTRSSVQILMADQGILEPTLTGYEDRDQDLFEDAVYSTNLVDHGSAEETAGGGRRQGLYARWEVDGSGYLAPCGQAAPVGVVPTFGTTRLSASVTPNPAHEEAVVHFQLPRESKVRLSIFDIGGREQVRLVEGVLAAGRHEVRWKSPRKSAAQVYWYRLEALGQAVSGRFVVRN